jgi:hypothetical protein
MSPPTNNWTFGSSLLPVVCRRAHVLLMKFGSSLPPDVCRRAHVLLMTFGSSLPPVVCRRTHVLFMMFDTSLPPVVCRRAHVLFMMFDTSLPPVVCRRVHVNITQYVLDTTIHKQTQITQIRYDPSQKQPKVKTNRTLFSILTFIYIRIFSLLFAVFLLSDIYQTQDHDMPMHKFSVE